MRVAVIRADLPRLPARDGHVPVRDPFENFIDVPFRIPLLLVLEAEDMHDDDAPLAAESSACGDFIQLDEVILLRLRRREIIRSVDAQIARIGYKGPAERRVREAASRRSSVMRQVL